MRRLVRRPLGLFLALTLALAPAAARAAAGAASPPAQTASPASSAPAAVVESADDRVAVIAEMDGAVTIQHGGAGDFAEAHKGAKLRSGDVVSAAQGWCELSIGQARILLSPETTLQITEALHDRANRRETTRLSLESGQIRAKVSRLEEAAIFEVTTPTAIATVRGTTLFLKQGLFDGQPGSELYVDEAKRGVDFLNRASKESLLVPPFSLAHSLADGTLDPPTALNKEEREAFIKNWNAGGPAQQFGVEEIPLSGQAAAEALAADSYKESLLSDAALDRLSEKSIASLNSLPPPAVAGPPTFAPKEEPDDEEQPTRPPPQEEPNPPPAEEEPADPPPSGGIVTPPPAEEPADPPAEEPADPPVEEPAPEEVLAEQERDMIRREIAFLLGDQDFDQADANLARIADAQTGKVFTDAHGYRVRVDQYIFQQTAEGQTLVNLLSLTARTGPYQTGVSALEFFVLLNRALTPEDGPLRNLPWNDWMRVVTGEQLTGTGLPVPYEQFIVHEHFADPNNTGPDLYPQLVSGLFSSPSMNPADAPVFLEGYSDPEFVQADQGDFWVQGLLIQAVGFGWTGAGPDQEAFGAVLTPVGSAAQINTAAAALSVRQGAQTAGLAGSPLLSDLDTAAGLNAVRNAAVHPAFYEAVIGESRTLLGVFLPINDQGQVIDAPGFAVRGLRDLVFPNTQVNGGNYNLQTIWAHGVDDGSGFTERFRIDLIVTPEIFSDFGLKNADGTLNESTIFSSRLDADSA